MTLAEGHIRAAPSPPPDDPELTGGRRPARIPLGGPSRGHCANPTSNNADPEQEPRDSTGPPPRGCCHAHTSAPTPCALPHRLRWAHRPAPPSRSRQRPRGEAPTTGSHATPGGRPSPPQMDPRDGCGMGDQDQAVQGPELASWPALPSWAACARPATSRACSSSQDDQDAKGQPLRGPA